MNDYYGLKQTGVQQQPIVNTAELSMYFFVTREIKKYIELNKYWNRSVKSRKQE